MPKPLNLLTLKASMAVKGLTLEKVARAAGVPYTTASEVLSGARNDARRLRALSKVIEQAPGPKVTVCA